MIICLCRALFSFSPDSPKELRLQAGQLVRSFINPSSYISIWVLLHCAILFTFVWSNCIAKISERQVRVTGRVDNNWSRGEVSSISTWSISNTYILSVFIQNLFLAKPFSCSFWSKTLFFSGERKERHFPLLLHCSHARVRRGQGCVIASCLLSYRQCPNLSFVNVAPKIDFRCWSGTASGRLVWLSWVSWRERWGKHFQCWHCLSSLHSLHSVCEHRIPWKNITACCERNVLTTSLNSGMICRWWSSSDQWIPIGSRWERGHFQWMDLDADSLLGVIFDWGLTL